MPGAYQYQYEEDREDRSSKESKNNRKEDYKIINERLEELKLPRFDKKFIFDLNRKERAEFIEKLNLISEQPEFIKLRKVVISKYHPQKEDSEPKEGKTRENFADIFGSTVKTAAIGSAAVGLFSVVGWKLLAVGAAIYTGALLLVNVGRFYNSVTGQIKDISQDWKEENAAEERAKPQPLPERLVTLDGDPLHDPLHSMLVAKSELEHTIKTFGGEFPPTLTRALVLLEKMLDRYGALNPKQDNEREEAYTRILESIYRISGNLEAINEEIKSRVEKDISLDAEAINAILKPIDELRED